MCLSTNPLENCNQFQRRGESQINDLVPKRNTEMLS